jgi:hypothetical protein
MASDRAKREMARLEALGLTETVSYMTGNEDARAISACVDRQAATPMMQGVVFENQVCVLNDPLLGIDAANMDVGSDRIELAERVGGTAKARGIQRIISQDADFLTLAVQ